MIAVQNIIDKEKSLMTIIFNKKVMDHLKCKCDDYLVILQSNFKPSLFLMVKADTGYRIKRSSFLKKMYEINIRYGFKYIPEFNLINCTYYFRKHNMIRINLKV
jgi:hypothetical protein